MLRHNAHAPRGAHNTHTSSAAQRTVPAHPAARAGPRHTAQKHSSAAHASRAYCHRATATDGCIGSSAVAATGWQSCRCRCVPSMPNQQHQQQQLAAAAPRNACIAHAAGRGGRSTSSSRGGGRRGGGAGRGGGSDSSDSGGGNSAWQDRLYAPDDFAEAISSIVSTSTNAAKQRPPAQQQQQQPPPQTTRQAARTPSSKRAGSSQRAGGSSSGGGGGGGTASPDFVVIKKGSPSTEGAYIASTQDLQEQEELLDGSRFWEAALADLDAEDDEDDEGEDGDEDEFDSDDEDEEGEGEDDDVEVEEVVSLLRELAAGLEDEETAEGEGDASELGAAAAASGSSVGVQWRQAYLGSEQPPLTLGPVCVKQAAGKGRGLFTTSAVSAGEVLLVGAPLVLLYSEEGTTPENEELAEHLAAAVAATAAAAGSGSGSSGISRGLAPWQQQALLQLRPPGGVANNMQRQQQHEQELPDLRQLLGPASERVEVHDSSSSDSSSSDGSSSLLQQQAVAPQQLPDVQMTTQLVFANCTGEEFEDQALVLLRGATSCGHLGIWPAAALINHGCAPNCNAMLLGDRLVVRAAHDIPAATELTLSYLGPQLFAPAAVRQAELKQQWGFDCGCSRCKAEARYASSTANSTLANDLQTSYDRCQELSPVLDDAVDAEDLSGVRSVQRELLQLQDALEGSIRAAKPPANVRKWLQASAYDLYDLLSLAADQLPPPPPKSSRGGRGRGRGRGGGRSSAPPVETEALATCARIVGELTPGSSAHVELATEYMVRAEARFGMDHQEAADASRLCAAAITTRYTPLSTSMLQLLMDTWAGAALL